MNTHEKEQYMGDVLMKIAQLVSEYLARAGARGSMILLFSPTKGDYHRVANVTEEDQVELLTKVLEDLKSTSYHHKEH